MSASRVIIPAVGMVFVVFGTIGAILFAKGYRPDFNKKSIQPSGILVTQSYPDGAQVLVNNELKTATNNTLNLDPGTYQVEIKKDGFVTWQKTLQVQAEVVTRAIATLFPSVPSLKAITVSGASVPVMSPDGSKIAFLTPDKKSPKLYTLDLTESPLGFINRDPKLIATLSQPQTISWSPDSRQITLTASTSAQLIDIGSNTIRDLTPLRLSDLEATWSAQVKIQETQKRATLPDGLKVILDTSTRDLVWSPKEDKIMYTATASAVIADNLIRPLPGSSTQPQARTLVPQGVYVYDLIEDRNFQIDTSSLPVPTNCPPKTKCPVFDPWASVKKNAGWSWFSNSYHLMKVDGNRILIKEYDNQNLNTVYSGPMSGAFAAAYPSGKQILILSNLNTESSPVPNLYAISLR